MDFSDRIGNYDFINLGELKISSNSKIVILYARFMHITGATWTLENHSHSFYELHFPLRGTCGLTLQNNKNISLKKNDYILIHPNTIHRFTRFSEDFFRLSIAFDIQYNNSVVVENDKFASDRTNKITDRLLSSIINEYNTQGIGYKNIVNFHIQTILLEVLRLYPSVLEISENMSKQTLKQALTFIRNNISVNITASDVAENANLSLRQLNRIFNSNLNMTVSGFIKNERIIRVREHLEKTNLSLPEIASLTGFNDEFVLCKSFKKIAGISPGKYRAEYKKKHRGG